MNAKGYQEIEPVNSQIENQYTDTTSFPLMIMKNFLVKRNIQTDITKHSKTFLKTFYLILIQGTIMFY